jgi:hypothetical protein
MKERTFEDFLQERHSELYPMVLDDDLPDSFDNWLGELDGEDYIKYADLFAQERFLAGMDRVINKLSTK